jgi:hypothetical protein
MIEDCEYTHSYRHTARMRLEYHTIIGDLHKLYNRKDVGEVGVERVHPTPTTVPQAEAEEGPKAGAEVVSEEPMALLSPGKAPE